jgi:hypothetical protein
MFIAVVSEFSHQEYRKPAPPGNFPGYPGIVKAGIDQAATDYLNIRIVPVPAQIGPGIRGDAGNFRGAGTGGKKKNNHRKQNQHKKDPDVFHTAIPPSKK